MIRSSKHSLKFCNTGKNSRLKDFIKEYRTVAQQVVDQIWDLSYGNFSISLDKLDLPLYLDYKVFNLKTSLSARVLRCLTTQLSATIRSVVTKRKKLLYVSQKNPTNQRLKAKLLKCHISKPDVKHLMPELNSICANIIEGKSFQWFICLKSLGKSFGKVNIPIKGTSVSDKWKSQGNIMPSIMISDNFAILRFKVDVVEQSGQKIIGADQGMNTVLTLSDGQTTPNEDMHGHSFASICNKLARKKKGSKAFGRAQDHRKNFINWSINQINWSGIKEVRLENIKHLRHGKRLKRTLSHWTHALINKKLQRVCESLDVPVVLQDSQFRSQRCSSCGLVRKSSRKGKTYRCRACNHTQDADLNASLNLAANLPTLDWNFRMSKPNLGKGFYWVETGKECTVPYSENQDSQQEFSSENTCL